MAAVVIIDAVALIIILGLVVRLNLRFRKRRAERRAMGLEFGTVVRPEQGQDTA